MVRGNDAHSAAPIFEIVLQCVCEGRLSRTRRTGYCNKIRHNKTSRSFKIKNAPQSNFNYRTQNLRGTTRFHLIKRGPLCESQRCAYRDNGFYRIPFPCNVGTDGADYYNFTCAARGLLHPMLTMGVPAIPHSLYDAFRITSSRHSC